MSSKRDHDDVSDGLDDGEISEPSPKRPRKQPGAAPRHHHQNSSVDPTWGQKYVFADHDGATTIPYGEEDDFEDDADAMAYLSSVRREANGIPHLLVAPRVQIGPQLPPELQDQDEGEVSEGEVDSSPYDDPRAYYDDGAYIALSSQEPDTPDNEVNDAYFAAILRRYRRLRAALHSSLPATAASRLSPSHLTFAAPFGRNSRTAKTWSDQMRHADPHPVQLALMSKETTMRVLRVLLGGTFLRRGHSLAERTSQWLWALLARLPDAGELNHIEVACIRDLGRRAVLLSRSLAEMAALREELADEGLDVHEDVGDCSDEDAGGAVDEAVPETHDTQSSGPARMQPETKDAAAAAEEEGEAAMDLESPGSEEGQVDDLEAAKGALLAKLEPGDADDPEVLEEEARTRQRMNMRATINMILTVAGEFYGQRDLLEFREPFVGM